MKHFLSAKSVVSALVKAGHVAYFAGGWVRDYLLSHPSDDIDIATSASVKEIQSLFPKTIPVGAAFGIVIVVEGGHHFEVATFRKESGYLDGRRPTSIMLASAEEDAQRRDFTINGMFWDPLEEKLYDFVDGQKDLKEGIIRAIGDPHKRFLEDRLRMMRAARYATRFNFLIEEKTRLAIMAHASSLFPSVAVERVWQEFKKMSAFDHFDLGLILLYELQLLEVIFPRLKGISLQELKKRLRFLALFPAKTPALAELMELFPDDTLEELRDMCAYLKVPRQEKEMAQFLHKVKQLFQMPSSWLAQLENYEWAKLYAHPLASLGLAIVSAHLPEAEQKLFLLEEEKRQAKLLAYIDRIQSHNPVVKAEHLMNEGINPGKKMGLLLQEAEKISVNQQLNSPQQIIAILKSLDVWRMEG